MISNDITKYQLPIMDQRMGLQVQTLVRYPSYKSGWIPYLIRAFGNPNHCQVAQHKLFRSGQVFGVERGHFWRSCPLPSRKASSKSQEGMQMLKFRRLGPWQRRSVLHLKSHVGSITVATGVEHLETTTAHLQSCNRVGVSNKNTLTNLKSLLWDCKDMPGCLFLSVTCNN